MGRQGFESFAATTAAEEKPTEAHFHKHWHPKKARVVHESKDIDCDFDDQKNNPKGDQGHSVHRKCFPQVSPVSVVILMYGGNHCDERDTHDTRDINLEAETKAGKILFCDEPLEAEEKDALDDHLAKSLAHNFWKKRMM